jgi:hypothetical protein
MRINQILRKKRINQILGKRRNQDANPRWISSYVKYQDGRRRKGCID